MELITTHSDGLEVPEALSAGLKRPDREYESYL